MFLFIIYSHLHICINISPLSEVCARPSFETLKIRFLILLIFKKSYLGGSSTASTKSATIEMYVGSSTGYNDTMSGETMSSISEKSGSYISDGGHDHQHQHQHAHQHHPHHRHHIHHPTQPHLLHTTAVTTEFEVITFFVSLYYVYSILYYI